MDTRHTALSLHTLERIPDGLLEAGARDLHHILPGPTLLHLPGKRAPALFVSVLLHGNEDTGLRAVQELLWQWRGRELPRALSLFIGNLSAARYGLRRLEGQPDYNRVWPGGPLDTSPEGRLMREVLEIMRRRGVFVSVDIHNNTGRNPHYACLNRLNPAFLHLALLFSRTVVYFLRPAGVQSLAFAELCPAVTVECGQAGQSRGTEHALEFLNALLHLSELPAQPPALHDIDLFHTAAVVKVPEDLQFGFGEEPADLCFNPDLDHLNFCELPRGTVLGTVRDGVQARLYAWSEQGEELGARYFTQENNTLRTQRPLMPSMFTLDKRIIRQDCLGYVMERMDYRAVLEERNV